MSDSSLYTSEQWLQDELDQLAQSTYADDRVSDGSVISLSSDAGTGNCDVIASP